jgi:hypothetical protein
MAGLRLLPPARRRGRRKRAAGFSGPEPGDLQTKVVPDRSILVIAFPISWTRNAYLRENIVSITQCFFKQFSAIFRGQHATCNPLPRNDALRIPNEHGWADAMRNYVDKMMTFGTPGPGGAPLVPASK